MVTKFLEKLGEGTAGLWTARGFTPALVFWGVGLLAWVWRHGWAPLYQSLAGLDPTLGLILAVGLLVAVVASDTAVTWLQPVWLRLAAGSWPWPFSLLGRALVKRLETRLEKEEVRWAELRERLGQGATDEELQEFARLDAHLALYPADPEHLAPTRLGNLLRRVAEHPWARYSLDFGVTWPHLWLLLPEPVRKEISEARQRMDERLTLMGWAALLGVWAVWAWWAVPLALALAVLTYLATWVPAEIYGDLVRAAYDLHRLDLYRALGWQVPEDPNAEQAAGRHLTEFLFRGPPVSHPDIFLRGRRPPYRNLRRHRATAFSARRRRSASPPKTHRRRTS